MNTKQLLNQYKTYHRNMRWRPFLCLFREKHKYRYFHCTTIDDLCRVSLTILKERHADGIYAVDDAPADIRLTPKQIAAIPEGTVRTFALSQNEDYDRELRHHKEGVALMQLVEVAIAKNDGPMALAILNSRSNHEYEGFTLHPYDVA